MWPCHLPSPAADFPQDSCFQVTERLQSLMPCPQCLLCSACLGKVLVSGGGWQADLFLEDRAKGVSQRPGCFLVLKSLLFFFFFYSFLFKQLEGIWCKAHFLACPSAVISFLSCVLISDSWISSHLDFMTPPNF